MVENLLIDNLNRQIDALSKQIEANEREQDNFMSSNGVMSKTLYNIHEKLCDEMEDLCRRRRDVGKL